MRTENVKTASMSAWILAVGAFGYLSGTNSVAGWSLLAAMSVLPAALMAWLWRAPSPSMSETIRDAIR
jgi:hypothetical protein